METAFRALRPTLFGSRRRKGLRSLSLGMAMYSSFPSSSAVARTGSCGESGFAFTTWAWAHSWVRANRRDAASAPTKLGIRLLAPGNLEAFSCSRRSQTRSLTACLVSNLVLERIRLGLHSCGGMAERTKVAVLKTARGASPSRVRIPFPPR
jgi:hypothetical protein